MAVQRTGASRHAEWRCGGSGWLAPVADLGVSTFGVAVNYLVNKELLDLYDKYEGDFGLLDERWAAKADREGFSQEQTRALSEYVERVRFSQLANLSPELKRTVEKRIGELESMIEPDVVSALNQRLC